MISILIVSFNTAPELVACLESLARCAPALPQPRDLLNTLSWPGFYRMILQPRFRALVRSELMKSLFLGRIARDR